PAAALEDVIPRVAVQPRRLVDLVRDPQVVVPGQAVDDDPTRRQEDPLTDAVDPHLHRAWDRAAAVLAVVVVLPTPAADRLDDNPVVPLGAAGVQVGLGWVKGVGGQGGRADHDGQVRRNGLPKGIRYGQRDHVGPRRGVDVAADTVPSAAELLEAVL